MHLKGVLMILCSKWVKVPYANWAENDCLGVSYATNVMSHVMAKFYIGIGKGTKGPPLLG